MSKLIQIQLPGEELGLEFLEYRAGFAHGTLRSIFNAWVAASVIDERGFVWVKASKLHTILRTNKDNARYLLGQAPRKDVVEITIASKYRRSGVRETLIRSTKVCEWVNHAIQNPASPMRSGYLRYSDAVYRQVRDCAIVKELRAEFGDRLKGSRRSLKRKRMKRLKLKHDELTGKLLERSAEFAHIRCASIYFELADLDWNGVVVNSEVHRLITAAAVMDERSLLDICRARNWSTAWEAHFMRELRVYELTGQAA